MMEIIYGKHFVDDSEKIYINVLKVILHLSIDRKKKKIDFKKRI